MTRPAAVFGASRQPASTVQPKDLGRNNRGRFSFRQIKSASSMATAHEFELACPACGPGIYAVEDGFRLRVGLTSNLSRFVRRQRTRVRLLHIARMEPGEAPGAWRTLLSHLRAQGLAPKECQFEAGAAHVVAQSMARAAGPPSTLAASDIRRLARRARTHRSSPSPDRGGSVA